MNWMQATHFFRPRLFDSLSAYNRQRFSQDVGAGLTVGVVALPLAMAFAIASGLKPEAGLFTAIIAGFLISAMGGNRYSIAQSVPNNSVKSPKFATAAIRILEISSPSQPTHNEESLSVKKSLPSCFARSGMCLIIASRIL